MTPFKFISLNIWCGGKLMNNLLEFLRHENPEVLALQEVYNGHDASLEPRFRTMDFFRAQLDYKYDAFAPTFFDGENGVDSGNAVFSRFPITSHAAIFFDSAYSVVPKNNKEFAAAAPRNMCHAKIDWQGTELNVYSWHGIWAYRDGSDNPARTAMIETILAEVKNKPHVILAGDSNLNHDTAAAQKLDAALTNVFGTSRTTSFNMRQKTDPGYGTAVVDLMYVSPDITVTDATCPDIDVSDHLPLIATIN